MLPGQVAAASVSRFLRNFHSPTANRPVMDTTSERCARSWRDDVQTPDPFHQSVYRHVINSGGLLKCIVPFQSADLEFATPSALPVVGARMAE